MKKNENIFISLQIQKDKESNELFLNVQFDKTARNFSMENNAITWCPTSDEIDFITDAFHMIGEGKSSRKTTNEPIVHERPPEEKVTEPPLHSSEMRIAPLQDDNVIEITADSGTVNSKKKEVDEKIFIQADEKKIDEILKRKKPGMDEEYVIESGEKTIIDRMLKQKKKKD
jgi:hypothetical protein